MMFFCSSRRRHTRFDCDWSSDVCSSDLGGTPATETRPDPQRLAETVHGRVAVVTGGATGLGRATALEFAQRGTAVAINYLDPIGRASGRGRGGNSVGGGSFKKKKNK